VAALDDGREIEVEAAGQRRDEFDIEVLVEDDTGEFLGNMTAQHGLPGSEAAIGALREFVNQVPPSEAANRAVSEDEPELGTPQNPAPVPVDLPEQVGDYAKQRSLNPDQGDGHGSAVYTGNGFVLTVTDRATGGGWEVDVGDEVGQQMSDRNTLVRNVDAETARDVALDFMQGTSAPDEVNGWVRSVDAEGVAYQTPDNTALAFIEETQDDQFRPQIQRDELDTVRFDLEDSFADAIDRLVDALGRRDPEGFGLADEPDEDEDEDEAADQPEGNGWTASATPTGEPMFQGETADGETVEVRVRNGQREPDPFEVVARVRGESEQVATANSSGDAADELQSFVRENDPEDVASRVLGDDFAPDAEGQASLEGEEPDVAARPPQSLTEQLERLDTPDTVGEYSLKERPSSRRILENVDFGSKDVVYQNIGVQPMSRVRVLRLFTIGGRGSRQVKVQLIDGPKTMTTPITPHTTDLGTFDSVDEAWDTATDFMRGDDRGGEADEGDDSGDEDPFGAVQQGLGDALGQAEFETPDEPDETDDEPDDEPEDVPEDVDEFADTRSEEEIGEDDDDDGPETKQGGLETFQTGGRRDPEQAGLEQMGGDDDGNGNGNGNGDSDDTLPTLPTTPGGRRAKAEREVWDEIGPFEATFPNVGLVQFRLPGENDPPEPKMWAQLNTEDGVWRAVTFFETSTSGSRTDETLRARGSFDAVIDALREAVDDEWWKDEDDGRSQEAALDLMADNSSWSPEIIRAAFDVSASVASQLAEFGDGPSDLLQWNESFDGDLSEIPGVGEQSARKLSQAIPKLKSRGVTRHDRITRDDENGNGDTGWADALEYIREWYSDTFQERTELGSDLSRFGGSFPGDVPDALASEGVLQPIVRFQDTPPGDVRRQIENKVGEDDAERIIKILTAFASFRAARDDDTNSVSISAQGSDHDLPRAGSGWRFTEPTDDPEDGIAHGPTHKARWERGDELLAIKGRGTNHRLFYWSDSNDRDSRRSLAGPDSSPRIVREARSIIYGDESALPDSAGGSDDEDNTIWLEFIIEQGRRVDTQDTLELEQFTEDVVLDRTSGALGPESSERGIFAVRGDRRTGDVGSQNTGHVFIKLDNDALSVSQIESLANDIKRRFERSDVSIGRGQREVAVVDEKIVRRTAPEQVDPGVQEPFR
jgi:hypothetical protein